MDTNASLFKYFVYYPVVWLRGQWVPHYLGTLLETQYLPPTELEAQQLAKLNWMLAYAARAVPFHRDAFAKVGPPKISSIEDMGRLPFTTKAELKRQPRAFVSEEQFRFITRKTTGGSTGEPLTLVKTRQAMAWELAATWRGYSWAGVDIGDRQGRFWGVPITPRGKRKARLIDLVAHRRRCSAFAFDEQDLQRYTETLRTFRPAYFYGYVSMLEEYAKFFYRNGTSPPFALKCVITTSEVLTEHQRHLIEQVFAARVFNEYGSGELGSIAHECEHGSLHLSAENMLVEVLDGNRRCGFGEIGELVVTELNNIANPLIRYRTGDFAALAPGACRCGRTLPVIEKLYGRAYDTIRNSDGKLFHGEFMMYIFEEAQRRNLGIRAFQVIQESFHCFRVRIVPDTGYGRQTEEFLTQQIQQKFDPRTQLRFEQVPQIERAPSGKMRLVVGMTG